MTEIMKNWNEITQLHIRAEKVGYHFDASSPAYDGTYFVPSIGHWRSAEQIDETVAMREEQSTSQSVLG